MKVNEINAYLQRAREIIGEWSPAEIEYDDAVVGYINDGMDIKKAIAAANRKYPEEALKPNADHPGSWPAVFLRQYFTASQEAITTGQQKDVWR